MWRMLFCNCYFFIWTTVQYVIFMGFFAYWTSCYVSHNDWHNCTSLFEAQCLCTRKTIYIGIVFAFSTGLLIYLFISHLHRFPKQSFLVELISLFGMCIPFIFGYWFIIEGDNCLIFIFTLLRKNELSFYRFNVAVKRCLTLPPPLEQINSTVWAIGRSRAYNINL